MQTQNKKENVRRNKGSTAEPDLQQYKGTRTENKQKDKQNPVINVDEPLTETFLKELDSTLLDPNETLNSTIISSQMDDKYEVAVDGSITELKTVTKSSNKDTNNTNTKKKAGNKSQTDETTKDKQTSEDRGISCVQVCSNNSDSSSICCNLCMEWFHPKCVGINDIDFVGAWVCASCRLLPKKGVYFYLKYLIMRTNLFFLLINVFIVRN